MKTIQKTFKGISSRNYVNTWINAMEEIYEVIKIEILTQENYWGKYRVRIKYKRK